MLDLVRLMITRGQSKEDTFNFFANERKKAPQSYPELGDCFLYQGETLSFREHFFKSYPTWQDKAFAMVKELRGEILNKELSREHVEPCFWQQIWANGLLAEIAASFSYTNRNTNLIREIQRLDHLAAFVADNPESDSTKLAIRALKYREEIGQPDICVTLTEENPEFFLFLSIKTKSEILFDHILEIKPKINIRDEVGFTPLMIAAAQDDPYFAERLISQGADINMTWLRLSTTPPTETPYTALSFAAYHNNKSVIQLLLEHQADANVQIIPETKKEIIIKLLELGMDIVNIPIECLNNDIMAQFVNTCQKRFPEAFEGENRTKSVALIGLWKDHKISLSQEYYQKLLYWDCYVERGEQTTSPSAEIEAASRAVESIASKIPTETHKKQLDPSILAEMNRIFCASYGDSPTQTQSNKLKGATASARNAQKGPATTPSPDKSPSGIQEEPFLKIFKLTPEAGSRKLDKKQAEEALAILQKCINVLKSCEINVERKVAKNHPLITIREVGTSALKEFYLHHVKSFKLAEVKPGNSPCTDHYNEPLSALIQYMCEIVERDVTVGTFALNGIITLMQKFVKGCKLDLDVIAEHYPHTFKILTSQSQ